MSSMSSRGVAVVEGSLQHYDDDDSSDDEEDLPQEQTTSELMTLRQDIIDDGDEELEVFTGAVPPVSTKNVVEPTLLPPAPPVNINKPKLSLIDAMEASVRQIEDQIRFEEDHAHLQSNRKISNPPTSSPPPIAVFDPVVPVPTATTDVFGIVYKPIRKKKQDYQLPSGPAFEDEAEFERELSQVGKAQGLAPVSVVETEDDEFDFDDGVGTNHNTTHHTPLTTTAATISNEGHSNNTTTTMMMMSLEERQALEAEEERRIVTSLMAENARMTG